jgi:hypothetical protein
VLIDPSKRCGQLHKSDSINVIDAVDTRILIERRTRRMPNDEGSMIRGFLIAGVILTIVSMVNTSTLFIGSSGLRRTASRMVYIVISMHSTGMPVIKGMITTHGMMSIITVLYSTPTLMTLHMRKVIREKM